MKEIKFRAWDKRFKKMEHGSSMAILNLEDEDHELMQFTGLLDKNGKKIYRGDVIKHTWEGLEGYNQHTGDEIMEKIVDVGEVVFEDGAFRIKSKPESPWNLACLSDLESIEVIGDIYSTPSLLKK